ncbi:sulfotransferase family 2 domain-containing protein [Marinovum sp. SP66]|uniref:sulfotransferase family 2 domain-containing protein n=1 Tax=Marinovum TaxID=367771 RepID=UPI00237A2468|nr:sulfotransferase family 2 domain-containing protein [Marinovum sp. SP66]MDD9741156.1 sulfotransferase family 2 domain-containing protein [Marinovum sp. SP66]
MIISRGRRYIFVHIPKTGGTAMALALEARAKADDILIGDTPKALRRRGRLRALTPRGRLWKHSTLADIDGVIAAGELDRLLIFTLVRNPWDRVVSYYHWLQVQSFDHPAVTLSKRLSFAAFLQAPQIQASLHNTPAASYVTDAAGRERPARFLRLEHLAEDMPPLEAHLGFRLTMPHANRSARAADYRSYYDDAGAGIIARVCAADIARFGYAF